MVVISDTSIIVALKHLRLIHLLENLFQKVIITQAVYTELKNSHIIDDDFFIQHSFIHKYSILQNLQYFDLAEILDIGEAESIIAYKECNADLLLIDEAIGRKIATGMGIKIMGILGILLEAKYKGLVVLIKPMIDELQTGLNFWLSTQIVDYILQKANE